jgi:hypothetical protein
MSGKPEPISASVDWLGRLVCNHLQTWIKLGNFETKLLAPELSDIQIKAPVYICGLARSGSTVLLEMLARHPDLTAHRYQDFPFLFTPYWWNTLLKFTSFGGKQAKERAHGDGIMVTPESPEAMEEILWMAFFDHLHNPNQSNVLDANTHNAAFESFYLSHIQKLLLARKRARYVSKGNYNISRMAYLQRMSPDARFIIPIRDPVSHVVSLMKQHKRFCEAGNADPRATAHMSQVGHFEFGLNRIPINMADQERIDAIQQAWNRSDEVRGLALYWDMIYRFVYGQLQRDKAFAANALVIAHATLCAEPESTIRTMLSHCSLQADDAWVKAQAATIAERESKSPLTSDEIALIKEITGETAGLFGMK